MLSQNRCFLRGFRQFFITSYKMPRLPRNLHRVAKPCQCDSRKTRNATRLKCRACHAKCDGHVQSGAPATKSATHLLKTSQKYCACHTKPFSTRYKTCLNWMSRSATLVRRNEATRRLKPPKSTPSAELTIGRPYGPHANSYGRLRTIADGCERLRTVANGCERKRNVERTHLQPPDPHRVKREPWLRIRENRWYSCWKKVENYRKIMSEILTACPGLRSDVWLVRCLSDIDPTSTPELPQLNIQELWKPGYVSFMYVKFTSNHQILWSSLIMYDVSHSPYHHWIVYPAEGHYGAHPHDAAARRAAATTVWNWEFLGHSSHLVYFSKKGGGYTHFLAFQWGKLW